MKILSPGTIRGGLWSLRGRFWTLRGRFSTGKRTLMWGENGALRKRRAACSQYCKAGLEANWHRRGRGGRKGTIPGPQEVEALRTPGIQPLRRRRRWGHSPSSTSRGGPSPSSTPRGRHSFRSVEIGRLVTGDQSKSARWPLQEPFLPPQKDLDFQNFPCGANGE